MVLFLVMFLARVPRRPRPWWRGMRQRRSRRRRWLATSPIALVMCFAHGVLVVSERPTSCACVCVCVCVCVRARVCVRACMRQMVGDASSPAEARRGVGAAGCGRSWEM